MQVCTSLQTDNHASTPPLSFLQAGCPSCHPTNSVKTLKGKTQYNEEEWGIESSSVLNRWVFRETGIKLWLKLAKWTLTISYRIVSYRIRAWYCWSALTDRRHTYIHLTTHTIVKRKAWIWGADGRSVSRRHWWWANRWVFRWDLNELKLLRDEMDSGIVPSRRSYKGDGESDRLLRGSPGRRPWSAGDRACRSRPTILHAQLLLSQSQRNTVDLFGSVYFSLFRSWCWSTKARIFALTGVHCP